MQLRRIYQQAKNIYHFLQAHAWRIWYGRPDVGLHIYGVTGTNGKTTTSYLIAGILEEVYGKKSVGMLTTTAFRVGAKNIVNETKLTTLPSSLIYRYLREMKRAGVTHVVIELTSHALDQNRAAGLSLEGAAFLNISPEHLNYHGTIEALAKAKIRITEYLQHDAPLVYNKSDEHVRRVVEEAAAKKSFRVVPFTRAQAALEELRIEGDVNKENGLAARMLMQEVGVSEEVTKRGIRTIESVPGRMEWITLPSGAKVVIDYAVTPDALEKLYVYVKGKSSGKIFGVLGAAGLRDREKRAKMAVIVSKLSDELVITREDPWTEDEEQIFTDLEKGISEDAVWQRIVDRRQALAYCLQHARENDTIVVTGKGAETGMAIGDEIIPWNDKEVILELAKGSGSQSQESDQYGLLLNTAADPVMVILTSQGEIVAQKEFARSPDLGAALLTAIDEVLREHNLKIEDIQRIGAHVGPEPYSAVRSGIVTAELLAEQYKAALIQITGTTIEEMLQQLHDLPPVSSLEQKK